MTRDTESPAPTCVTEDVLGDYGFRLEWSVHSHYAEVTARLINDRDGDSVDVDDEVYLTGYVKWDGCTELDQGCNHWCGPCHYTRHFALLKHIYLRAFELMDRTPWEEWRDNDHHG